MGAGVRVTDFMAAGDGRDAVVRIVEGLAGEVRMGTELVLRPDYGRTIPWVERLRDEGDATPFRWRGVAGPAAFVLSSPVPLRGERMRTTGAFSVREGERLAFELAHTGSQDSTPEAVAADALLDRNARPLGRVHGAGRADRGPAAALAGGGGPLGPDAQGADLRADGRHRGRGHHLAARAPRRDAQLGLPLLLAARRGLHARRAAPVRPPRRGAGLARLAGCAR